MQACTIIARNYLPFARVLAESYCEHHPGSRLTALVIDDRDRVVDASSEPFDVLHLDAIAPDRRELHRQALIYDVTELATAVKPLLLRHLLAQGHEAVVYLDPDICVYSPFDGVEALAVEHDIVLTPHTTEPMERDGRKPSEADILASGVFNLGFLVLGAGAGPFLEWWSERLRRDCLIDHQRMLFTDQRWIDFVPGYFRHHVLRDGTMNVAYWNVDQRRLTWSGSRWELDGEPLRFFHFSGFTPTHGHLLSRHQGEAPRVLLSERPDVAALCADYASRLNAAGLGSPSAPYGWDRLANGVAVDAAVRTEYRRALAAAEQDGAPEPPDPFDDADAFCGWLAEPTGRADAPINRYLHGLWQHRPVLRDRFPYPLDADADDYRHWVRHDASPEVHIPARFLPPDGVGQPVVPGPTATGCNVAGYFRAELGVGEGGRLMLSILNAAAVPYASFVYGDTASRQDHPFTETGPRDAPYDVNVLCINADRVGPFAAEVGPRFFAGRHTVGMWAW